MADPVVLPNPSLSSDIRQRRSLAPQYSYYPSPSSAIDKSTTYPAAFQHPTPIPWTPYLARWQRIRSTASYPKFIFMRLAEIIFLAGCIRLSSMTHHFVVQSIDNTWETVSRRARSPFYPINLWGLGLGVVTIFGWHVWLAQASIAATDALSGGGKPSSVNGEGGSLGEQGVERKEKDTKRMSWGRVLGEIVIPAYLALSLVVYIYPLLHRLWIPVYITSGTASGSTIPGAK